MDSIYSSILSSISISIPIAITIPKLSQWNKLSRMMEIKQRVSEVANESFSVCIEQKYHTGKTGINHHRDKEMVPGTIIAGVSFGETRTLEMKMCREWQNLDVGLDGPQWKQEDCSCLFYCSTNHKRRTLRVPLPSGSMYIFRAPTNDHWSHSILKDDTLFLPRISMTFRNYTSQITTSTNYHSTQTPTHKRKHDSMTRTSKLAKLQSTMDAYFTMASRNDQTAYVVGENLLQ
jgi:alkylated DNA repair dioxygenase AlkB